MTTDLPTFEFAFPGPLRDKLVAAVLDGTKTATTGLLITTQRHSAHGSASPNPHLLTSDLGRFTHLRQWASAKGCA
ncbi:MAG TPA: hypothetical protein VFY84_02325 [Jiangellales bacterium]|nr:hypothetical protein [Jiangellales bacterium]